MLTVAGLGRTELARRLSGQGLWLQTGVFTTHLRSPLPALADGLALLYADYPVLDSPGFADFHVELAAGKGLRRWYHPQVHFVFDGRTPFKPLPADHAFPMFEWGMNYCITASAHNYLIVHAAVLERDGCALILPAPSGSGKSTLTAALASNGWRLLSDELALLRLSDDMLVPMPRPVSLKNASIDIIRNYVPDAVLSAVVEDTHKGTVTHMKPPPGAVARAHETARAGWIVFPKYEAGAAASMTPMPKARAFMGVAANAFNYTVLGVHGFDALARLTASANCHEFRYSALDDALHAFAQLRPPAP